MSPRPDRRLILSAFVMCGLGESPGLWRHPDNRTPDYTRLSYWTDLATELEHGGFDLLFLADVLGPIDTYKGTHDVALRGGMGVPMNDPTMVISAMAAVTETLGFGVTVSTTYEQPYTLARKLSSLDHFTNGRVGWNIITTANPAAARNLGYERALPHGERYDRAQDFLEACYKLWEGSWEEDAVIRDREAGVFVDPAKVHKVEHRGPYFTVVDSHMCEPSPQRTPFLFQAGASTRGREFAARNAELVFIGGQDPATMRRGVQAVKDRAAELGRDPAALRFIGQVVVVAGRDDAEAQAKYEDYLQYVESEYALALCSGATGADWSQWDLDDPIQNVPTDGVRSVLESLTSKDRSRDWTTRDVIETTPLMPLTHHVVGGPQKVADELQGIAEEIGLDGFNFFDILSPGTYADFAEHVVPELRRRGALPEKPTAGVLREQMLGAGQRRLRDDHPGAAFRNLSAQADGEV